MLALPDKAVSGVLNGSPLGVVPVNKGVDSLILTLGNVIGEGSPLISKDIRRCTAEDRGCQVIKALVACCGHILYLSAVGIFKKCKLGASLGRVVCGGKGVNAKPLQGLAADINIKGLIKSIYLDIVACPLGSGCSGNIGSGSVPCCCAATVRAASAGSKGSGKGKCQYSGCKLLIIHFSTSSLNSVYKSFVLKSFANFCIILFGFTVRVLYIIAYCANKVNYFLNCRPIFILFAQIFTYFFATIKLKSK